MCQVVYTYLNLSMKEVEEELVLTGNANHVEQNFIWNYFFTIDVLVLKEVDLLSL